MTNQADNREPPGIVLTALSAPGPDDARPSQTITDDEIRDALRRHFHHDAFRTGQLEAVRECVAGRDVVVIMPTGSGKSICYQLAAMLLPGTTLVVSPLIALMKDQTDALEALDIPSTFINSSVSAGEMSLRLSSLAAGLFKLVYVAPERFRNERFQEAQGLKAAEGGFEVSDDASFAGLMDRFRQDSDYLDAAGKSAAQYVTAHAHATAKILKGINL